MEHPCPTACMSRVWYVLESAAAFARWEQLRAKLLILACRIDNVIQWHQLVLWNGITDCKWIPARWERVPVRAPILFPVWSRSGKCDFFSWVLEVPPFSCLQTRHFVSQKVMAVIQHACSIYMNPKERSYSWILVNLIQILWSCWANRIQLKP